MQKKVYQRFSSGSLVRLWVDCIRCKHFSVKIDRPKIISLKMWFISKIDTISLLWLQCFLKCTKKAIWKTANFQITQKYPRNFLKINRLMNQRRNPSALMLPLSFCQKLKKKKKKKIKEILINEERLAYIWVIPCLIKVRISNKNFFVIFLSIFLIK